MRSMQSVGDAGGGGGASPQWQNEQNEHGRLLINNAIAAVNSGDVNALDKALRDLSSPDVRGGWSVGIEYVPVFQQIFADMTNLGGISPETQAMIANWNPPVAGDFSTSRAERGSYGTAMTGVFKQWADALPVVTSVPGNVQVKMTGLMPGMTPDQYMQQYVTNMMLGNMDAVTKQQTQQALAQANPFYFRAYGMMNPQEVQAAQAGPSQTDLTTIANQLDFNKLRGALPKSVQSSFTATGQANPGAPLDWLQSYLNTAATGVGGTREQQALAQAQLAQMEADAQANDALGGYLGLAQSLVNPVLQRSSLSNIIGQDRALTNPSGTFRRGGFTARNPYLT